MANDEFGDKTEQPTERRRREARESGNVARSTDLTAAGLMLAAATAILLLGIPTSKALAELMHAFLGGPAWLSIDKTMAVEHFLGVAKMLAGCMVPLFLMMTAAAIAVNFAQVGFLIAPEAIQPSFERLHPVNGAKQLLSARALVRLGTSLTKLTIVAALSAVAIQFYLPTFLTLSSAEPPQILLAIEGSAVNVGYVLAAALMLLALLDFLFQKWSHERSLRMSKQEIREEMKTLDGDPTIRQRRRDAHRKFTLPGQLHAVHEADVVIIDPTQIAVALKYDPQTMTAPMLTAAGRGEIAQRIRTLAAEHGIPIIERQDLARSLSRRVKVGDSIPAGMFEAFAEIMAYVYRLSDESHTNLADSTR